jgi:hypothetical protein
MLDLHLSDRATAELAHSRGRILIELTFNTGRKRIWLMRSMVPPAYRNLGRGVF